MGENKERPRLRVPLMRERKARKVESRAPWNTCFTTEFTEDTEVRQIQLYHEEHEDNEGKPGNAALRSGFKTFRLWRPTPRRWITPGGPPVAGNGKQLFVCGGNPDSSGFPLATLLPNF